MNVVSASPSEIGTSMLTRRCRKARHADSKNGVPATTTVGSAIKADSQRKRLRVDGPMPSMRPDHTATDSSMMLPDANAATASARSRRRSSVVSPDASRSSASGATTKPKAATRAARSWLRRGSPRQRSTRRRVEKLTRASTTSGSAASARSMRCTQLPQWMPSTLRTRRRMPPASVATQALQSMAERAPVSSSASAVTAR